MHPESALNITSLRRVLEVYISIHRAPNNKKYLVVSAETEQSSH